MSLRFVSLCLFKQETEAIRREIVLQRQQKQQIAELLLKVQAAEECNKAKEDSLKSFEDALRKDQASVEEKEKEVAEQRNRAEELQSKAALMERKADKKGKQNLRDKQELEIHVR